MVAMAAAFAGESGTGIRSPNNDCLAAAAMAASGDAPARARPMFV
jgi:hypothetical protein